jgi:hypothetical protein
MELMIDETYFSQTLSRYFFMWKTTDRYVRQKRAKLLENDAKLKEVYVPAYTSKATRLTGPNGEIFIRGRDCDAYPNLQRYSWSTYKRYGRFIQATTAADSFMLDRSGLPSSARLGQLRPGLVIEPELQPEGPHGGKTGKSRSAFMLRTTPLTIASRKIFKSRVQVRRVARRPGRRAIGLKAIKTELAAMGKSLSEERVRRLNSFTSMRRPPMGEVVKRLGQTEIDEQAWLVLTPKEDMPKPEKEAFPRPKKRADGSYIYEPVISRAAGAAAAVGGASSAPQMLFRRQQHRGQPEDQLLLQPVPNFVPPKERSAALMRNSSTSSFQRQTSNKDAPEDIFFKTDKAGKRARKKRITTAKLRKAARKPTKLILP